MTSVDSEIKRLKSEKEVLIKRIKELEVNKGKLSEDDYNTKKNQIERALVEIMDKLVQYEFFKKGGV
ncbi:MAG: hypothetical protein ACTSO9_20890 [Candidatus Helarchaeota archaeon]